MMEKIKEAFEKLKIFCGVHFVSLTLSIGGIALLALLAVTGYGIWYYEQVKFHDLTVELGTEVIGIEQFMTEYANPKKAHFVTDISTLDIGKVGTHELTLANGRQEQTVTFIIEDTTPPEVTFITERTEHPDYVPNPRDFVESIFDLDETIVTFTRKIEIPEDYRSVIVPVEVKDASGNAVRHYNILRIVWLKDALEMELGTVLTAADLLFCPDRDEALIDPEAIAEINGSPMGEYPIESTSGEKTLTCTVTVVDTTGPELVLKECRTYIGTPLAVEKYVESATDLSGEVTLELLNEPDYKVEGVYTVTIQATDIWGNVTTAETTLAVSKDMVPPSIGGLTAMTVAKHSKPDYLSGVYAIDAVDGKCKVTYDASGVNVDAAGTYYVTYSSRDKSNNLATAKRKIVVAHDAEDTKAMCDRIAASLGSDPEALRDYVRSTIGYNHNWGGDDPVWYGYTTKGGNCYVHALCLRELLSRKGYTTQLIWTTQKTHYWLLINLNGTWRHIDPTPSSLHSRYSLMTDDQRVSTLSGRDWDRSAWPACN